MATKKELAEQLTVTQLKELAAENDVDLAGATKKDEIVDVVIDSRRITADDLKVAVTPDAESAQGSSPPPYDGPQPDDEPTQPTTGDLQSPPQGRTTEGLTGITAAQPTSDDIAAQSAAIVGTTPIADAQDRSSSSSTSATGREPLSATELDQSAADREVAMAPTGEKILVKVNPEMPTPGMVASAIAEVPGPVVTEVTVTDGDGNSVSAVVPPSTAAAVSQAVASENPTHPAFTSAGHWSNPDFPRELTDEEREQDQQAYAERIGA